MMMKKEDNKRCRFFMTAHADDDEGEDDVAKLRENTKNRFTWKLS